MEENLESKVKTSSKIKKLDKKISALKEKNETKQSKRIDKKIMKLEKKKEKHENWLKIKLPFRILLTLTSVWLVIVIISHCFSYIPVLKEIKVVSMAAIAYVAPEPVAKALDVVTLNFGIKNDDFNWLKKTVKAYMNGEKDLKTESSNTSSEYSSEKLDNISKEVLGTNDIYSISSMSISELIMKVATNATPELVSEVLDMSNLTSESKKMVQQDANRALKIIPKLNGNQMNELVKIIEEKIGYERADSEQIQAIQNECENFIESVRSSKKITSSNYSNIKKVLPENYTVSIEIKKLDKNSSKNGIYDYKTVNLEFGKESSLKNGDTVTINIKNSKNQIIGQSSGMISK